MQKFGNPLCGYLDDLRLFFCFVMVVYESIVCSEQLNWALFFRKILQVLQIIQFSRIFCLFEMIFQQKKKNLDNCILFKSFHPPALNALCFLLEHQWMFEPFLIVVFESLSCPQCEKMDLKIIQSLLERVQICKKSLKTEESAGPGRLFWRFLGSFTAQDKQGTHEQPSQNKKTVVDHPGNHTQY